MQNQFTALLAAKRQRDGRATSAAAVGRALGLSRHTINALTHNTLKQYPTDLIEKLCAYFDCEVGELLVLVETTPD